MSPPRTTGRHGIPLSTVSARRESDPPQTPATLANCRPWHRFTCASVLALGLLATGPSIARAEPLDPQAFSSLGTLVVPLGGTLSIDTDALTLSAGGMTYTGVVKAQQSGPEIAVFTFDSVTLNSLAAPTLKGVRALAILSRTDMTTGGSINFQNFTSADANLGVIGRLGGGSGGNGGNSLSTSGKDGSGPGAGAGAPASATSLPGIGGSFGGSGSGRVLPGTYGNLLTSLVGGSGGGGGNFVATGGGGGGSGGCAVELGATGLFNVTGNIVVSGNSGLVGPANQGGGGSGGGLLLHGSKLVVLSNVSSAGGNSFGTGHGGGGGRITMLGLDPLVVGGAYTQGKVTVDGGNGTAGSGRAGVITYGSTQITIPTAQSLMLSVPTEVIKGQGGPADARIELFIQRDLTIQGGGSATLAAPAVIPPTGTLRIDKEGLFKVDRFNDAIGALTGDGKLDLGTGSLSLLGSLATTFGGTITGTGQLVRGGDGSTTLSGSADTAGLLVVSGGTLQVDGNFALQPVSVRGGSLRGVGSVGKITSTAGTIAPGGSQPGTLSATDVNLGSGSMLSLRGGATADQLQVSGTVTLAGDLELDVSGGSFDGTLTLINNTGAAPVSGQFARTLFKGGGATATINYAGGDGNDVTVELHAGAATGCQSSSSRRTTPSGAAGFGLTVGALGLLAWHRRRGRISKQP